MDISSKALHKYKHIITYGISMAVLIFLLKWMQWKFLISDNSIEIYIGLIALLFTILGIWIAQHWTKPKTKTLIIEKEIYLAQEEIFKRNEAELKNLNLTSREYEVLQLLALGYSNAQIAAELFLSISTIKTHVSKLFSKMDVQNRFQAMEKAKRLKITP